MVNTGTIRGGINVDGNGGAVLDNAGAIVGSVRLAGSAFASSKVVNGGLIDGDLTLSSGIDTYDGRNGRVDGTVFGRGEDDRLKGGTDDDDFAGEAGQDELVGRGGDDGHWRRPGRLP